MGPGRAQDRTQARVWMAPPRDSNRLLGLSDCDLEHLGASRWAPLVVHTLRVFPVARKPVELDSVCQFSSVHRASWVEVEQSLVRRPYLGLIVSDLGYN